MSMFSEGSFDWPALMRLGIKEMRLKPDDFWALSPAEFLLIMGINEASAPMARKRLIELATAYPDLKEAP